MRRAVMIGIILGIIAVVATTMIVGKRRADENEPITLTVWGPLEESEPAWRDLIARYETLHPGTKLVYRRIPFDDYEGELINAFAEGTGPDIFYVHNTAVPKFAKILEPMPQGNAWMTFNAYRDTFVDVVVEDFTRDEKSIYAVPLFIETLALYYNKELLAAAGIHEPPRTWKDIREAVRRLTIVNAEGDIVRGGIAMGTATNVNRAADIFGLLMLQMADGRPIVNPATHETAFASEFVTDALDSYVRFADPRRSEYTWNTHQWYSIDAFVDGRVAMMLNYPHHLTTIRSRAPQLSFGIAPAPQTEELASESRRIDYANYWGLAVRKTEDRKRSEAAWRFLLFMAEPEQQRNAIIRYTREPVPLPARRDLIGELIDDPTWGVFMRQALTARSWYQPDHEQIELLLEKAIDATVNGAPPHDALALLNTEISRMLRKAK